MEAHPSQFTQATASQPGAGTLDFNRVFQIAWRRAWLPLLFAALALGLGFLYLLVTPKVYQAHAVVQVEQSPRRVMDFKDAGSDGDYKATEVLKTFEQVLTNGSLMERVVRVNNLDKNALFAPPRPGGAPYTPAELRERMLAKVDVTLRRGTRLIDILVNDRDPAMAARLAQSVVDEYHKQILEQRLQAAGEAKTFLAGEEQRLGKNLADSEAELARYRAQNQAVSLEDKQNIVVEKLRELSARVTEAKGKRLQLESDIAKIKAANGTDDDALLQLASINAVPTVADLRRQINEKEAEFAAIKERYLYKHIKYKEAESNLTKLQNALRAEIGNAADQVKASYQSAADNENRLAGALHDQENDALALDKTAIPYNALQRQSQSDRALYESVLARMKETGVDAQAAAPDDVREIESPTVPSRPVKPSKLKTLALALGAGLCAGFALALALELLKHTFQTVDQAEILLGLHSLSVVPEWKRRHRDALNKGMALTGEAELPHREAFRTLRTTLAMADNKETRSFLFTSAIPDEGKSFCSYHFASALAQSGCHTLLLNADLRRPCEYERVLKLGGKAGLSDCLAQTAQLAQVVQETGVQNLFVCPAGKRTSDAAELLAGDRFGPLLAEALKVFDRVVIDTPPINAVSDCLMMAPRADAVCLVVRARFTPVKAVQRAVRLLAMGGTTPVGFILNRLPMGLGAKSAYYYYGAEYHEMAKDKGISAKISNQ